MMNFDEAMYDLVANRLWLTTRQMAVMCYVVNAPQDDRMSIHKMAKFFKTTPPSISRSVEKLVSQEFLTREHRTDDRRYLRIEPTKKGRAFVERMCA